MQNAIKRLKNKETDKEKIGSYILDLSKLKHTNDQTKLVKERKDVKKTILKIKIKLFEKMLKILLVYMMYVILRIIDRLMQNTWDQKRF